MTERKVPRTRVATACERFNREISAAIKDLEAVQASMERIAELPFAEADDLAGVREINARTDALKPALATLFGLARKNMEEFERKVTEISRNPSAPDQKK